MYGEWRPVDGESRLVSGGGGRPKTDRIARRPKLHTSPSTILSRILGCGGAVMVVRLV